MTTSSRSDLPARTGTVTALTAQVERRERVNLFIDGEFALGISHNTLVRERIAVGVVIDRSAWERLVAAESADRALQLAMRMIERRPHTIHEVEQKLRRRGIDSGLIDVVVSRLRELQLLDDAEFAGRWVEERHRLSPRGRRALQAELRSRGIAADIVAAELAQHDAGQEQEQLEQLAEQVLPRYLRSADWPTFQRRLGGFLLRRGFAAGAVQPLLRRLWHAAQEAGPDGDSEAEGGADQAAYG